MPISVSDLTRAVDKFDSQGYPVVDRAAFEVFQVQLEALSGDGSIAAAIAPATAQAHHADDATRTTDLGRYLKLVTKNAALDLVLSIADGREEWRVLVEAYGIRADGAGTDDALADLEELAWNDYPSHAAIRARILDLQRKIGAAAAAALPGIFSARCSPRSSRRAGLTSSCRSTPRCSSRATR